VGKETSRLDYFYAPRRGKGKGPFCPEKKRKKGPKRQEGGRNILLTANRGCPSGGGKRGGDARWKKDGRIGEAYELREK